MQPELDEEFWRTQKLALFCIIYVGPHNKYYLAFVFWILLWASATTEGYDEEAGTGKSTLEHLLKTYGVTKSQLRLDKHSPPTPTNCNLSLLFV